ncbi:hypothetical protein [Streptomyces sp. SCL15-6]|uniref:hypothetical protein n=1 Tax=Streptomyces sp. SCL15-6 TaxID=2967222 RepID=UPI0029668011|nr:hypothetical protein [Streptomyces sp. SCL15-6]
MANAYRVLTSEGKVSDGFRWAAPQDTGRDARARLAADGVRFTATGAADPAQRLTSDDLAALLAGTDDDRADGEDTAQDGAAEAPGEETRAERFFRQLAADDSPETVEAVRTLFAHCGITGERLMPPPPPQGHLLPRGGVPGPDGLLTPGRQPRAERSGGTRQVVAVPARNQSLEQADGLRHGVGTRLVVGHPGHGGRRGQAPLTQIGRQQFVQIRAGGLEHVGAVLDPAFDPFLARLPELNRRASVHATVRHVFPSRIPHLCTRDHLRETALPAACGQSEQAVPDDFRVHGFGLVRSHKNPMPRAAVGPRAFR